MIIGNLRLTPFARFTKERTVHYVIVNETHLKGKGLKMLNEVLSVFDGADLKYEVLKTQKRGDAKRYTEKVTSTGGKKYGNSYGRRRNGSRRTERICGLR